MGKLIKLDQAQVRMSIAKTNDSLIKLEVARDFDAPVEWTFWLPRDANEPNALKQVIFAGDLIRRRMRRDFNVELGHFTVIA